MKLALPTTRWAQGLARALLVGLTVAWAILLVQELTGLGRWRALPMGGAKKFEARENRWVWHLPGRYATRLTELTGRLTENGNPLFRAASHKEVRLQGAGRFRLHGRLVSFSPWDNSDPNTNGRKYVFHAPRPLSPWLLWGGLAIVIGAHAIARHADPLRLVRRRSSRTWRGLGWRHPAVFGALLLVGSLAVRGLMVVTDPEHNDGMMMARGMPYSDASWWLEMARSMAHGHGMAGPSDGQRPGYPLMLVPLIGAGVEPLAAAQWLNVVMGAGAAALVGTLMARLAGPLAGLGAAAFLTAGGMQAKLLPLPMSETAGLALLATSLVLLWRGSQRAGRRDLILGGVFFALSNLACPFTLLALPMVGVVVAVGRGRWADFLRRGAWVAAGAALLIVPWLVRQKLVHGMATWSLNGPQMLYATMSPSGRWDSAINAPLVAAGIPDDPAAQARVYSRLFSEAVRRDPGLYAHRVAAGFAAWWGKFDPRHPAVLLVLITCGVGFGLGGWWRGGGPGALVAATLSPVVVIAASRLDAATWAALAVAGALATRDRRCWRFVGLAVSVVVGCGLMNALTSGVLANRLWSMADWLLVGLAVLALRHAVVALSRWRAEAGPGAQVPPENAGSDLPWLDGTTVAQGGWVVLSALVAVALAVRGPAITPSLPEVPAVAQEQAREVTLARLGLADRLPPDSPVLWSGPVRLDQYRAWLPSREAIGHWSRAFTPRNHSRTVATASTTSGRRATLQIPGDARRLAEGPWFAVGLMNHDPQAFLGAEIDMIEILALWPLDAAGNPAEATATTFFPIRSTVRDLLRTHPAASTAHPKP